MNSLSTESTDTTKMNRWLPRIVGAGLAILFLGVMFFLPGLSGEKFLAILAMVAGFLAVIVISFFWRGSGGVSMVRWWARIVGVAWAAFMAYFLIAESVGGTGPGLTTIGEWVSLLAWAAVFAGLVIAFFWEGIGGLIVALATLILQGEVYVTAGDVFNPVIMVGAFVGLAFVYCWWRTRRLSLVTQSAT